MKRFFAAFGAFLLALAPATPALSGPAAVRTVKIGLASYSGEAASTLWNPNASYFENGVRLAVADYAARLAARGLAVELAPYELPTELNGLFSVADKMIASDVVGVVGFPFSADLLAVGKKFNDAKLSLVSPSATADRVGTLGPYVRTTVFSNRGMARLLVKEALARGVKRVGIVFDADLAYSQDLKKDFAEELVAQGGTVVYAESILSEQRDFEALAKRVQAKPVDAVFLPNFEFESAGVMVAFIDHGIKPRLWLGGDAWGAMTSGFKEVLGARKTEALMTAPWHQMLGDAASLRYLSAFSARYKKPPHDIAVLGYTAAQYVLEALLHVDGPAVDRPALAKSLANVRNFEGVVGKFSYAAGANVPECPIVVLHALNGKVLDAKRVLP